MEKTTIRRIITGCTAAIISVAFMLPAAYAKDMKIGQVDLRKAFYEYEKSKTFDKQLNDVTAKKTEERNKKVEEIKKMKEAIDLLNNEAKTAKQKEVDAKITALAEFDRTVRQELVTKKDEMFREVINDIQKVVETIGKAEGYDYILDSRSVMYSQSTSNDITEKVLVELNKKK
ncbi:MAG TPA: OmpH family outer membrane protein [Candidatus Omnitrophota bacterium]|nr:OmpH family outer membrane protein [Candidatus Omnitrophota bacterium]HPS20671.1 OmpH family outer membrane protein [Candidatus Omnitrophota bacterium]